MIYCIGDSFTFGAELPDTFSDPAELTPSKFAWPALLEQKLHQPVTNLGHQGSGNTRVIKRAMDCVFAGDADMIIIAWPTPDRIEWCDEDGIYDIWAGRNIRWLPQRRQEMVGMATGDWTTEVDHWSYRRWLRNIIMLQTFFKFHNQRYMMFQTHLTQRWNSEWMTRDQDLLKHVDLTYFAGWPYYGLCEWFGDAPKGPHGHPLEIGHERIADKVYEYIRNFGWVS